MGESIVRNNELVKSIFSEYDSFEKYVLEVHTPNDKIEITKILVKKLIRGDLKENFNFLYIEDFSNFKFSIIINLLFREFANEWVGFAEERLEYSRDEALETLQEKEHTVFLFAFAKEYFQTFKIEYTREIANTFMELVAREEVSILKNRIIITVMESDLLKKDNVGVVYNSKQLWAKVHQAKNFQETELKKIRIKLTYTQGKDEQEYLKYKTLEQKIRNKPLVAFDEVLKRVRDTMALSLMKVNSFE